MRISFFLRGAIAVEARRRRAASARLCIITQLHTITFLLHCLPNAYHCESPLDVWWVKSSDYPSLASLARQAFSVPATSAPVEQMIKQAGKI